MKASNYLMEAAHSFRIYLKNHCAVRKPKKGEAPKPERKPNKAVIWVAKEYPKWQHMILSTLKELNGLDAIEVKHTYSPDTPEKTIEDCAPGSPHVNFIAVPGLTVTFTNPTPMSGLFTISVTLVDGDTVEKIKAKIAKEIKAIKDINALKLWRYLDPALGPRKIPVAGDHVTKCAELVNGDGIRVHVEASRIELVQNGTNIDVGLQFVYTYDK
ncbi:leucine--tRNA ligase, cytoplasmic-like [Pieris brassicae]|nr:leucine--tRNA ligase, cytoplasmic-like [Pieris brassicae]